MPKLFDVAVVGAGPAGAAAAIHAARAGYETLLLDAATFPRDKTCGDGLTPRAMHQLDLLGVTVNPTYRNRGLKLHGYGGSVTAPWPTSYPTAVGSALQRTLFDAALVTTATTAGATLWQGVTATDPVVEEGRLVSFRAGEHEVRAQWVIVADGVRSTFGKALGREWHRGEVYGIAARSYASSSKADEPWMHSHVELKDEEGVVQPGYGWIFPLGTDPEAGAGRVNIGLGALSTAQRPAKINTKKLLQHYAATQRAEWGLGEIQDVASALLPMGGAVSNVAGKNWALIGDAAACVNPLNGEGIDYGLETAAMVIDMIRELSSDSSRGGISRGDSRGDFSRGDSRESGLRFAWPERLRSEYGEAFVLARTLARALTYPQFLPVAGPIGLRGPVGARLMPAAARLMGNLVTDEDRDVLARVWRLAGKGAFSLRVARQEAPLWS